MEYRQIEFPGKTNIEKRNTDEYKKSFIFGMIYVHGMAGNGCINIVRNLDEITLDLINVFLRNYNRVRIQRIKNGLSIYPWKEDSLLSQSIKSMIQQDGKLSIVNVFNELFAPDFMNYVVDFFSEISKDETTYNIPLSAWANPADWQEFPKWLKAWEINAKVEDAQLICNKNDMDALLKKGVHTNMLCDDKEVLLHNKLTFKKDTSRKGPQFTKEYKRSILCSCIYLHGVVGNNYVDLVRNIIPADQYRLGILLKDNDWVHVTNIKDGVRLSVGPVKHALQSTVKLLQRGKNNKMSLKNAFSCIYAPNFMETIIEHFAVPSDNEDEFAIDMSWGNLDDLKYYPNWLKQYDVRARIDGERLYCNKADISKLTEQCAWINNKRIDVSGKPEAAHHRQYRRLRIKNDSSGKNKQTRDYKRFMIAALIYLRGKVFDEYIDIDIPILEEADQLTGLLRDNDWVSVQRVDANTIRIKRGHVKTALPNLLKKMQVGRDKEISLRRIFNYIYAPVFMYHLNRRHGHVDEKDDTKTIIDLSWAYQPDLPEFVNWLKVWGVHAEVDGSNLICDTNGLMQLERDKDYITERTMFEHNVRKYVEKRNRKKRNKPWHRKPRT